MLFNIPFIDKVRKGINHNKIRVNVFSNIYPKINPTIKIKYLSAMSLNLIIIMILIEPYQQKNKLKENQENLFLNQNMA